MLRSKGLQSGPQSGFACVLSCSVISDSRPHGLQPTRLLCPWDSPGKNAGVGCHTLLQGIFLTRGSNSHLLQLWHCRKILYLWTAWEVPSVALLELKLPTWWPSTQNEKVASEKHPRWLWPAGEVDRVLSRIRLRVWGHPWVVGNPHISRGRREMENTGRQRWAPAQSCPQGHLASSRMAYPSIPGPHRANPQVLSWALQVQPEPRAAQSRSTGYGRSQNHRINRYMLLERQVPSDICWVDKSSLLKFCYICLKRKPYISQSKTYLINKHWVSALCK